MPVDLKIACVDYRYYNQAWTGGVQAKELRRRAQRHLIGSFPRSPGGGVEAAGSAALNRVISSYSMCIKQHTIKKPVAKYYF
jgi:hypothetical protein